MVTSRHHLDHVLGTITALVNTSPHVNGSEELPDGDALRRFVTERIITEVAPPTNADVEPVHRVRARLAAIFVAPDDQARNRLINDALANATVTPRVVEHDDLGVHLHFFPPYASLAEHLNADCAMALAFLLVAGEGSRLRTCAAPDCNRVLVDFSRNRSRAYCDSRTCGNRVNAAAFRARQRH
ncbi:CGNR zinc finger domain-containing protein [Micromonospora echinofusca]|uniref:Zinc finger CGNR domain-containing protein n=1 Tax=Micromonospora echinofusca TaxID=47858 RepID=A0ABS3VKY6_MICEH|nr:CGNR zinc finger domain-containing protein [Micromonospora echinofusca]MBO4205190.1 hypothetical protein [Micromonospora echinofusca]